MEKQDLDKIYEKAMKEAALGKKTWLYLADKYGLGTKGAALLLPSQTPQYHEYSVRLLPEYMKKTGIISAVVLMEQEKALPGWMEELIRDDVIRNENEEAKEREMELKKVQETGGNGRIYLKFLPKEEMEALIRFYSFYEFTDRLIIGSLEVPAGRLGANMIGKKGLGLREAVGVMLYDIYI